MPQVVTDGCGKVMDDDEEGGTELCGENPTPVLLLPSSLRS
jgi:hypothetical protein